jgi:hypothetical protein
VRTGLESSENPFHRRGAEKRGEKNENFSVIFIPRENDNDSEINAHLTQLFMLGFLSVLCASAVKWF